MKLVQVRMADVKSSTTFIKMNPSTTEAKMLKYEQRKSSKRRKSSAVHEMEPAKRKQMSNQPVSMSPSEDKTDNKRHCKKIKAVMVRVRKNLLKHGAWNFEIFSTSKL
jgi:hypothetical protein